MNTPSSANSAKQKWSKSKSDDYTKKRTKSLTVANQHRTHSRGRGKKGVRMTNGNGALNAFDCFLEEIYGLWLEIDCRASESDLTLPNGWH